MRHATRPSFCLFVLTLLASATLRAQPYFDAASVHVLQSPSKGTLNKVDNPSAIQYLNAQLGVPLKLHKDLFVINPFFEAYQFKFNTPSNASLMAYSLGFPVTFLKQCKNENWKTAFVFIPRINSDFKNVSSNNYQFGGAVLAIYRKKENLKYKFGVYYNSEFFGTFILPLLGIDWNISDRSNLFGVLPGNLTFEYKLNSVLYGGINFKSITNSYRYNDSPYLKISDNYLKLFLDFYATNKVALTIEGGHSVLRKYKTGNTDSKITELPYHDGLLFKAGVAYRIRLNEKNNK